MLIYRKMNAIIKIQWNIGKISGNTEYSLIVYLSITGTTSKLYWKLRRSFE